jgi:hypothetical protein
MVNCTIPAVLAAAKGIEAMRGHVQQVKSLQEYRAGIR